MQRGWTALHNAARYGKTQVVSLLIADPRVKRFATNQVKATKLLTLRPSLSMYFLRCIMLLLPLQAGQTPLDLAREGGHAATVALLEACLCV